MRTFLVVLVGIALLLPCISYSKDYMYLDKSNQYRGYANDSNTRTDFYNRNNRSDGTYFKDIGAVFGRNNDFKGFIISPDRDDD